MLKTKPKAQPNPALPVEPPQPTLRQRLAQRRKANRLRQELVTFTIFAALFATVIGFVVGLAAGIRPGIGTFIGTLCTTLSFKYPRHALWAFLIYMPLSGSVTYALGSSPLLQLAKDGFYIPALFGVIQYCRREKLPVLIPRQMVAPVGILLGLCLITLLVVNGGQQLNPAPGEKPLLMGILGLKVLMGYMPLAVCAYYLLRDRRDLLFLMRLTVIMILTCCALAFIQYVLLKTGYCPGTRFAQGPDLYRASLNARCFVGGALLYTPQFNQIRLPGTFVAPWQWGWFLISGAFLAFATAFSDPKAQWRTTGLISLASVFIMAVLSGQRVALILVPSVFVTLLVLTGQVVNLKRFIPGAAILGAVLGYAALRNPDILSRRFESLQSRWEASPPHLFILEQFQWSLNHQNFLGAGLGRATNAARTLGDTELIETYYPKLLYEIGMLGTLAFLVVVTMLTALTFWAYRSTRDRTLRSYGAALWLFVLFISYNTYYYPLDVDPVAVYYWFFAGVVLRLPELERQERLEATAAQPQVKRRRFKRLGFA
ncbi:MAG: hormogonium polysaccharide biosynthesis protein HpsL [Cyanobacteriota bacterium]